MTEDNAPWIELSKKLGQLAARLVQGKLTTTVQSQTVGPNMKDKKFIHTSVLVGILTGQTKNGLNLINAPMLAEDIGIDLKDSHMPGDHRAVLVTIGPHQIKGNENGIKSILLKKDNEYIILLFIFTFLY